MDRVGTLIPGLGFFGIGLTVFGLLALISGLRSTATGKTVDRRTPLVAANKPQPHEMIASRTVRVEFIHERDGTVIGVADLAPEKLPDTFAVDTTLDIADKKWSVTRAEPISKAEFIKTRHLQVFLVPLTTIPLDTLRYTLPTISDDIGAGEGSAPPDDAVFAIHEDDWRQVAFVSQKYADQVALEFEDIRRVYDQRAPSGSFTQIHVRKRVPSPLEGVEITLADLEGRLVPKRRYRAVGIWRKLGTFTASFGWDIGDGLILWGTTDDGNHARILCLAVRGDHRRSRSIFCALERLCSDHGLLLVDWCRATQCLRADEIQRIVDD
jgi:hypothetical protein